MLKKYKQSSTALFLFKVMREMDKMSSELHEHRYYLEQNVAQRTEHLTKRIEVLEACNATLSSRLALSQKTLAALQHIQTLKKPEPHDGGAKFHIVNTRISSALRKHN
jgi:nitrate/nitrite-specific signal transduction histidine kinase